MLTNTSFAGQTVRLCEHNTEHENSMHVDLHMYTKLCMLRILALQLLHAIIHALPNKTPFAGIPLQCLHALLVHVTYDIDIDRYDW